MGLNGIEVGIEGSVGRREMKMKMKKKKKRTEGWKEGRGR